jgi:arylsulfatase A-like enzyme
MLTGVLPAVHGNVPGNGDSRYNGPTLAERLATAGYGTAAFIGGETMTDRSTGLARGFDVYDDQYRWDRKDLKRPGAEVVASALAWMNDKQREGKPFFAFVHLFDAHFPYTPSPPWDTAYTSGYTGPLDGSDAALRPYRDGQITPSPSELTHITALYDGELSELDAIIGPILNHSATRDAIVIVTADHGESFGHGYWFNHRAGLWDEITRVPLVIRGPGVPRDLRRDQVTGLVDITPTVLDLLGLAPLKDVHGRALFAQTKTSEAKDSVVFSITDPWRENALFSARSRQYKLIAKLDDGQVLVERGQGFDMLTDPGELAPNGVLPADFLAMGDVYEAMLKPVISRWQGPQPKARHRDDAEQERLRALGYVDGPAGVTGSP